MITGLAGFSSTEKMGTGSGHPSKNRANLETRPVPVPIFSPPLLGMGLVFGNVLTLEGKADGGMRLEAFTK